MVTSGCINISATFLEPRCAAIISSPSALIEPCIIIEPIEKIEFITAIVIPAPIIFLKSDEENLKSSFLSLIILKFFKITTKQKITDKSCAKTVATAAPITPIFVNLINK